MAQPEAQKYFRQLIDGVVSRRLELAIVEQ